MRRFVDGTDRGQSARFEGLKTGSARTIPFG